MKLVFLLSFVLLFIAAQAQTPVVAGTFTGTDGQRANSLACWDSAASKWKTNNRNVNIPLSATVTNKPWEAFYFSNNYIYFHNGVVTYPILGKEGFFKQTGGVSLTIDINSNKLYACGRISQIGATVVNETARAIVAIDISKRAAGTFTFDYVSRDYIDPSFSCNLVSFASGKYLAVRDEITSKLYRLDVGTKSFIQMTFPTQVVGVTQVFKTSPNPQTNDLFTKHDSGTLSSPATGVATLQKYSPDNNVWVAVREFTSAYNIANNWVVDSTGAVFFAYSATPVTSEFDYLFEVTTAVTRVGTKSRMIDLGNPSINIRASQWSLFFDTNLNALIVSPPAGAGSRQYGLVFGEDNSQPQFRYAKIAQSYMMLDVKTDSFVAAYGGGAYDGNNIASGILYNAASTVKYTCLLSDSDFQVYDSYTPFIAAFNNAEKRFKAILPSGLDHDLLYGSVGQINDYSVIQTGAVYEAYIAGNFRTINNATVNSIAKVTSAGEVQVLGVDEEVGVRSWGSSSYSTANLVPGTIKSIAVVRSQDVVYVGGSFVRAGNMPARNFAKYDIKTKTWSDIGGGVAGAVNKILQDGNKIYIAGSFQYAGDVPAQNIAVYDSSTQKFYSLNYGVSNSVNFMFFYAGNLMVLGQNSASGIATSQIASWNGARWSALQLEDKTSGTCNSNAYNKYNNLAFCDIPAGTISSAVVMQDKLYIRSSANYVYDLRQNSLRMMKEGAHDFVAPDFLKSGSLITVSGSNPTLLEAWDVNLQNFVQVEASYFVNGPISVMSDSSTITISKLVAFAVAASWAVIVFLL